MTDTSNLTTINYSYIDPVYGRKLTVTPLIAEVLTSNALTRLKGIGQFGIPDKYYHLKNYSRYEHSIGVLILLQKLGASTIEQIAGLIHDISHTAFSHVIDWVLGSSASESFQDDQYQKFLMQSDIPGILENHGIPLQPLLKIHHFSLLEKDLPDLCADRLDYAFREFPIQHAQAIIPHLVVFHNHIVVNEEKTALLLGNEFLTLQQHHWGGFEAATRYRIFANILKKALDYNIISMDDFWRDDAYVLAKLESSQSGEIQRLLQLLTQKSLSHLPKGSKKVYKKFRAIDPYVMKDGNLVRLSELNQEYADSLKNAQKVNKQGIVLPEVA